MDPGFLPGRRVRVTETFPPGFFDGLSQPPLVLEEGDSVTITDDPGSGTWPAFVLVRKGAHEQGWVPSRYVRAEGREGVATTHYDTTTLVPDRGELLTVIVPDLESGWLWCRDAHGNEGWFPVNRVSPES